MSTDTLTAERWDGGPSFARVPLPPRRTDLLVELANRPPIDEPTEEEAEELKAAEVRMLTAPKNRAELRQQIRLLPRTARRALGFGFNRNQPLVSA